MALRALDLRGDIIQRKDEQREFSAVFSVSAGASTQALCHQKAMSILQRIFVKNTSCSSVAFAGGVLIKYLIRSTSLSGHSLKSHSSA
ncbi:hypothetical protein ABH944_006265 [Caballeronia udeis]|uniref:Uncharacterized protein n=1 Tax=Caballeronia udeis TaxID=1232866 RepID=A0ABW8MW80_9BURK